MRLAVIYHPDRVQQKKLKAFVELAALAQPMLPTLWLETSADEQGAMQAKRAIAQGATRILVAGGDGTLRQVIEGVLEAKREDIVLGIIPVGTGNVLARNLALPVESLERSVRTAVLGDAVKIDLVLAEFETEAGRREQHPVSGISGLGVDAQIMMNTDPRLKRRIGWIAYLDGGVRSLPFRYHKIAVSVDGKPRRNLKLLTLLVGNCGILPGQLTMMPDAKLDDGILDVAAIGPRRFWNWWDFWNRVIWQNRIMRRNELGRWLLDSTENVKTMENLNGSSIEIWPSTPVDIQLDGDPFGKVRWLKFSVLPRQLNVAAISPNESA